MTPATPDSSPVSPFAASFHAARFQQFATAERPLTGWPLRVESALSRPRALKGVPDGPAPLRMVGDLAAGIAHGLKSFSLSLPPELLALPDGSEAVGRFQAFVAAHEEELTASVEVQEPIAIFDYQPYTRLSPPDAGRSRSGDPSTCAGLAGVHALMLTCGYNPRFVDLLATADEELKDIDAAIFPSRGYLDLESYGKLVVFTLRGGHLITFPEPVTRQPDGTPIRSTFLWPWPPRTASRPTVLRRLLSSLSNRRRSPRPDQVPRSSTAQVRDGVSTLLHDVPAAAYASADYYRLSAAARRAWRQLIFSLFQPTTARQLVPSEDLEVEATARLSPDGGCILFILNRLGAQTGVLHFPNPAALNLESPLSCEVLYTSGSGARSGGDGLLLSLASQDTLIVRLR